VIDGNPRPPNNKRRSIFSKPPHLCTDNWQPLFRRQHMHYYYALLGHLLWTYTIPNITYYKQSDSDDIGTFQLVNLTNSSWATVFQFQVWAHFNLLQPFCCGW
jgi:hypothetical protein